MKAKTFLLFFLLFMPLTAYAEHPLATKPILSDVVGVFDNALRCQALIKIVVYYTDIYQVYKIELEKSPPNKQASDMRAKLIKGWTTIGFIIKDLKIWLLAHNFKAHSFENAAFVTYQRQILTQIINDVSARVLVLNSLRAINFCNKNIDDLSSILDVEESVTNPKDGD